MGAVFKKDFKSALTGMTGIIFITAVLVFVGVFTAIIHFDQRFAQFEYALISASFASLLLTPILTMRSFSEERKMKTDQLLYSLPISTFQIVMGKFLAMAAIFAIPCAVFCLYPIVLTFFAEGSLNYVMTYGAILAYFLLGCAIIAICMFISSLTESQVISAIISIAAILLVYFLAQFSAYIPTDDWFSLMVVVILCLVVAFIVYSATKNYIAGVCAGAVLVIAAVVVYIVKPALYVGLASQMISGICVFLPIQAFGNGVFDITAYVYYLSLIALFIFATVQTFEKRRWN